MKIADIVAVLIAVPAYEDEVWRTNGMRLGRLWLRLSCEAALRIKRVGVQAECTPQEWDQRIDCFITLSDGSVRGEMISLPEITDERLRDTARRLALASDGRDVQLVDEIKPPIPICRAN